MRSFFQIILSCIACVTFWGCSTETPEESLLDQFARSLEGKAPYYREFHGVHKEYGGGKNQGKLIVDVNRVEVYEVEGQEDLAVDFKNKVLVTALDAKGERVWDFQAGGGAWHPKRGFFLGSGVEFNGLNGVNIVTDSLQWDAKEQMIYIPSDFSMTTNGRLAQDDSLRFMMLEGTFLKADARFDRYKIEGLKGTTLLSQP